MLHHGCFPRAFDKNAKHPLAVFVPPHGDSTYHNRQVVAICAGSPCISREIWNISDLQLESTGSSSMKCCFRFLTVFTLFFALGTSALGDWPQWRGPNRDGHSSDTGLLKKWPEAAQNSFGSHRDWEPVTRARASGDRLSVIGDQGDSNYLMAISLTDGKPLWKTKVGKSGTPGWAGLHPAAGTPTVDDQSGYRRWPIRTGAARDAATGAEIWARTMRRISAGRCRNGVLRMPLVVGDNVILIPGGKQGLTGRI